LTGELSTNLLSPDELECGESLYGTMVAPGVNAQMHQHLFSYRLDMAVDDEEGGKGLQVSQCDIVTMPAGPKNPAGNGFYVQQKPLLTESEAQCHADVSKGRFWKISNPSSIHSVTGNFADYVFSCVI
jgi:primary-amine oxidase